MFENILFQEKLVTQLSRDIATSQLPGSLLFHGPAASGKLTTALEMARVLSCSEKGLWNCPCPHCAQHRILAYSGLALVGEKDLGPEIDAAGAILMKQPDAPRRFLYIRTIRKLLKRFEPLLWEGEDTKVKSAGAMVEALQEELEALYPGSEIPPPEKLEASVKKIRDLSEKLMGLLPSKGIPINMVRRLSYWARTASVAGGTFIIIENADSLGEGARNSLLKILEEPPENVRFILLTRHKGAIMPTILSRVRPYSFQNRTPAQVKDILGRLFLETSGNYPTLESFFQAYALEGESQILTAGVEFFEGSEAGLPFSLPKLDWGQQLRPFLGALALQNRQRLQGNPGLQEKRFRELQDALDNHENLNISPALLLESLYYRWRP